MGNEPGKEAFDNGLGNDRHDKKKSGKRHKKEGMHIESSSKSHENHGILKNVDVSLLGHPLDDDIEKYYTVTDKILGMYVNQLIIYRNNPG